MRVCAFVVASFFLLACVVMGQDPYATVTGRVVDPGNATIAGAKVEIVSSETGVKHSVETNSEGIYTIPSLQPGIYRMEVSKPGFKALLKPDIILHVQDVIAINFSLPLGSISETVTVTGGAPLINTENAAVGTVIDRNFAENLPLNGRSFNMLLQLTPGVVIAPINTNAISRAFSKPCPALLRMQVRVRRRSMVSGRIRTTLRWTVCQRTSGLRRFFLSANQVSGHPRR